MNLSETGHSFNLGQDGFTSHISLGDRYGFIVNGVCIIEVHMQVDESGRKIDDDKVVESIENVSPEEMISTSSFGEVVDFRDIGKVEKDFVPLLEQACSRYPSLIDIKKRKSRRFSEWGFTALGRVLHFLNTKKVRDMDDDTCNHLQALWEELEAFGFDLAWLKPHVEYALGMKNRVEKVLEVKKLEESVNVLKKNVNTLKENVTTLEERTKASRTKMIDAEIKLEKTKRDLEKAKKGFEECDLDAEMGYGKS
ncbi:uncharacterized protein LOC114189995 [Vigna unguiculata]|uniref:uncharacterized protein LOC114189995 n=1 Tax=Vigna unguiculata TaxID=3917 RepID=UPI001016C5BA|nr:uncharacterized protein LOC114189995 [Vigna unguiculata]